MKILAFAYACEPNKGSEPGAGWLWVRMLARTADVWVLTRANNRSSIEAVLEDIPERGRLHFVYVDLPSWARAWKRGQRGVHVYYMLWQAMALARSRSLRQSEDFDLIWHLTLANAWLGSCAPLAGRTFVYGPVGGGVATPPRLLTALGPRGAAFEVLREVSRAIGRYCNPLARLAWRRASYILVQNQDTRDWLPSRYRENADVFENVVLEGIAPNQRNEDPSSLTALYAGRLLPWKGASLAIRAVALAEGWRLVVCGDGGDTKRLRRLARRLEIEERVSFRGWVSRSDLQDEMQAARVLLYPSLHDDAGWVVAEAMASGLPVICLDRGGPPAIAGPAALSISADGAMRQVTSRLAEALQHLEHGEVISPRVIERRAAEFRMEVRQRRVDGILRAGGRRLATHSDDLESASEGREPSSAGNGSPQLSEG